MQTNLRIFPSVQVKMLNFSTAMFVLVVLNLYGFYILVRMMYSMVLVRIVCIRMYSTVYSKRTWLKIVKLEVTFNVFLKFSLTALFVEILIYKYFSNKLNHVVKFINSQIWIVNTTLMMHPRFLLRQILVIILSYACWFLLLKSSG